MSQPMMACGCAAVVTCSARGGVTYDPPIPACFTHDCIEVAAVAPDLTGRRARCTYFGEGGFRSYECNYSRETGCTRQKCACEMPSSDALPFFVYYGPGSHEALDRCKHCRYFESAHVGRKGLACSHFEPIGDVGFDRFYCGCAGWD